MEELFRLKIASRRQVTVPQRLLDILGITEGDEIQIEVSDGNVLTVQGCKGVPTVMLSEEVLEKLRRRESQLQRGEGLTIEEALEKAGQKPATAGA